MKKLWLLLFVSMGMLMACSSQPTPQRQYYLLPTSASSTQALDRPLIVVQPVELAQYLTQGGLVYQTNETEVVAAQYHLWAERLADQLGRRLTQDLRDNQQQYWPTELTRALNANQLPRLQLRITQFNGHYQGYAVVSGEWLLFDTKGNLVHAQPFSQQQTLSEAGYAAQVSALSIAFGHITRDIAQQFPTLVQKTSAQ